MGIFTEVPMVAACRQPMCRTMSAFSELIGLQLKDLHVEDQWLKVMGKGQKERIVPFGGRASKLLQRYLFHFSFQARAFRIRLLLSDLR